ncbi:MAG: hypothetical protein ACC662_11495, partial [Planctomycetota bacterium]
MMDSRPRDDQLLDRHLAGILTPAEEARLEHLIRSSPAWTRRYREAEEMAALLRRALRPRPAPREVKRRVHEAVAALPARAPARPRSRHLGARRLVPLLAAAVVLVGLTLFLPRPGGPFMTAVHADEPWALKDLARSADVLMIGRTRAVEGTLRFRPERILFGETRGRALQLPEGLVAGQRIALFGRYDGDDAIRVVGDLGGVIHLDGIQQWEGRSVPAVQARALLARAATFRSLESAQADLRRFLASDASRVGVDETTGLSFSAAITARFLGRFDAAVTGPDLVALVTSPEKDPEARNAGADAMVEANPLGACRGLLTRILGQPVEMLHAETEDGMVVLPCLRLIQRTGQASLQSDLEALGRRVRCPVLARPAER